VSTWTLAEFISLVRLQLHGSGGGSEALRASQELIGRQFSGRSCRSRRRSGHAVDHKECQNHTRESG
jgi:hypothetical protein